MPKSCTISYGSASTEFWEPTADEWKGLKEACEKRCNRFEWCLGFSMLMNERLGYPGPRDEGWSKTCQLVVGDEGMRTCNIGSNGSPHMGDPNLPIVTAKVQLKKSRSKSDYGGGCFQRPGILKVLILMLQFSLSPLGRCSFFFFL